MRAGNEDSSSKLNSEKANRKNTSLGAPHGMKPNRFDTSNILTAANFATVTVNTKAITCSQNLQAMFESSKNVLKKNDPTTKASEDLIRSLMEQKTMHEKKKKNSEDKSTIEHVYHRLRRLQTRSLIAKHPKRLSAAAHKKTKATTVKTHDTSNDFGRLLSQPMGRYVIPDKIFQIETGKDVSHLSKINELVNKSGSNRSAYIQAYTAFLHLEEAAEVLQIKKYEQTVRLSYCNSRIFRIKKDVS